MRLAGICLCMLGLHRWQRAIYGATDTHFWRRVVCVRSGCRGSRTNVTGWK
jgi:hypothetical protein